MLHTENSRIYNEDGVIVATVHNVAPLTAAEIVAAVNAHDDLIEALDRAADALANDDLSQSERMYEAGLARAALARITP